jgi:dTDP-4-dehydrorhamnose 3,5-epimerase
MNFNETKLKDVFLIELEKKSDERGFFARAFDIEEFKKNGLENAFVQANTAFNYKKGTLRGMHFQKTPHEEVKLVRCTRGELFDVVVDLREDSPTFKQWFGVKLSEENGKMLYIPKGFAHGYLTLRDDTEIFYMVSEFYTPGVEGGVRYNDPAFGIEWPVRVEVISEKDNGWEDFKG